MISFMVNLSLISKISNTGTWQLIITAMILNLMSILHSSSWRPHNISWNTSPKEKKEILHRSSWRPSPRRSCPSWWRSLRPRWSPASLPRSPPQSLSPWSLQPRIPAISKDQRQGCFHSFCNKIRFCDLLNADIVLHSNHLFNRDVVLDGNHLLHCDATVNLFNLRRVFEFAFVIDFAVGKLISCSLLNRPPSLLILRSWWSSLWQTFPCPPPERRNRN